MKKFNSQKGLLKESHKELFLNEACAKNYTLFFEHDSVNECCDLHVTEKGIRAKTCFNLDSLKN